MKGYTAILAILVGILIGLLFLRMTLKISKTTGTIVSTQREKISVIFILIKSLIKQTMTFNDVHFKLVGIKGSLKLVSIHQSAKTRNEERDFVC
jgi:TRAP-type C4-dicarboxylate transport system permease large subunit